MASCRLRRRLDFGNNWRMHSTAFIDKIDPAFMASCWDAEGYLVLEGRPDNLARPTSVIAAFLAGCFRAQLCGETFFWQMVMMPIWH